MLPNWALRVLTQPYSVRLPKKEVGFWQKDMSKLPGCYQAGATKFMPLPTFERIHNGEVVPGNLPNMEYEFWIGFANRDSKFCMCRWCRHMFNGPEERREHFRNGCCPANTKIIIRLLAKDPLCVICEKRTTLMMWGLPLCSPTCVAAWKFDSTKLRTWEMAVDHAEDSKMLVGTV